MLVLWEWEGEAYDKLVMTPITEVPGKGRRNGRVSEWFVAAYDLGAPAQAKKCLETFQPFVLWYSVRPSTLSSSYFYLQNKLR